MDSPTVVFYRGIRFARHPKSKYRSGRVYFYPSAKIPRRNGVGALHQEIWKDAHGPIPRGWHVHHADDNSLNNALENLECLPAGEHMAHHGAQFTTEGREWRRRNLRDRAVPKAAEWHRAQPPEYYSRMGRKMWATRVASSYVCQQCGAPFRSRVSAPSQARFCSNNCKSAARRASGVDNVERVCATCGRLFVVSRYSAARCCSRLCGAQQASRKKRGRL